jgi:Ca2+-binding RTX toxin-like protein
MATFNWTTLTNNQVIAFNPLVDVLNVNDATLAAADIGLSTTPTSVSITLGSKTVTLQTERRTLTTSNVTFSDGSMLLMGDNTTNTSADDSDNVLTGGPGDDRLYGLGGNDTMSGGPGNDEFTLFGVSPSGVPWGDDVIDGGDGSDTLSYPTGVTPISNGSLPVNVNLATGVAASAGGTTKFSSIETVLATGGNDVLIGGDPSHGVDAKGNTISEFFVGRGGDDTITGSPLLGFFTIADYAGNTTKQAVNVNLSTGIALDGVGGTDTLTNVDSVRGGAANDTLVGGSLSRSPNGTFFESFRGNAGNDTINGNNGKFGGQEGVSDRADYANNSASQAINVNLTTGVANDGRGGTDTLIDIDQVLGGAGNDTFIGNKENNQFDGGRGNDKLDGGEGADEARFQQSTAGVIVNLGSTPLTINGVTVAGGTANDGMGGTDTLISIEQVRGSDFNDVFRGSDNIATREFFTGDAGDDFIDGGAGIDFASYASVPLPLGGIAAFIENGAGVVNDNVGGTDTLVNIEGLGGTHSNDILKGGFGDQWLRGRGGSDLLDGGPGSDWVTYGGDPAGVTINLSTGSATDGYNGPGGILALGGVDTLVSIENAEGSDFDDTIIGSAGINELRGRGGNDTIDGGDGADTAVYTSVRNAYDVVRTAAGFTVTDKAGTDGTDSLLGVERLRFTDDALAFDLGAGQSAGNTVRLIGAAFGASSVTPDLVGIGIRIFDQGLSMVQVAELALNTDLYLSFADSHSNVDFVNTVYRNVVGTLPSDAARDFFVGLLQGSGGTMTQAELLALAADQPLNEGNISLVGLQQNGVEFVPVG